MVPQRKLYSLMLTTPRTIELSKPRLVLEAGRSVFTIVTDDIETLVAVLTSAGATVHRVGALIQPPTSLEDMLLEGEDPRVVFGTMYGE